MKNKINALKEWAKNFSKRCHHFWFTRTVDEERMRELRNEHLKYYYSSFRM
jgi:hypothetical protein